MGNQLSAIVIGAGDRGNVYASYSEEFPDALKIVAVADPHEMRRTQFAGRYHIPKEYQFTDWTDVFSIPKFADFVIIATPDKAHVEPAIAAMDAGYDVLLEKPMSPDEEGCINLVQVAEEKNKILQICHVLRYTDFFGTIKEIIDSGTIGDIVTIDLRENVSYFHYAHSFIRGNWHNRERSSPMILAKSCHDMDILYGLVGSTPKKISSFGKQTHFGEENKPSGAPPRCTDGCPVSGTCLYYAPRIYLDIVPLLHVSKKGGSLPERFIAKSTLRFPGLKSFPPFNRVDQYSGWPVSVISEDTTLEGRLDALKSGPYGRCVYDIDDHNVVDHQVVIIEFDDATTATFTLHGHSSEEGRSIRIDGTRGTIMGKFMYSGNYLEVIDSLTSRKEVIMDTGAQLGHGGGDLRLMDSFIDLLNGQEEKNLTSGKESLLSHQMAFAADISRIEERTVNFEDEYIRG